MRAMRLPVYFGIPLLAFEMHYFVMLGFLGFVWSVPLALGALAVVIRNPLAPRKVPTGAAADCNLVHPCRARADGERRHHLVVLGAHLADHQRPAKGNGGDGESRRFAPCPRGASEHHLVRASADRRPATGVQHHVRDNEPAAVLRPSGCLRARRILVGESARGNGLCRGGSSSAYALANAGSSIGWTGFSPRRW